MPTYRMECVLQYLDGRSGPTIEGRNIEAASPGEAIAKAKAYRCERPTMWMSAVSLFGPSNSIIWSLRAEKFASDDVGPEKG